MTNKPEAADHSINRKALMRYLLEQAKAKNLSKDEAIAFLSCLGESPNDTSEDIAIVGMSCRFPDAENKEKFWDNLVAGRNSIGKFPQSRVDDLTTLEDSTPNLFEGGFLERIDLFDNEYFNIPPVVANHMDPYQRLMLEVLVETIEDAGYSRSSVSGQNVGVYVGNDHAHRMVNNYLDFINIEERDFNTLTGSWSGVLASRLSYLLNLSGPAMVVDTACSSGLVALDTAIKALHDGDCDSALVGAVNLFFRPWKSVVGEIENEDYKVYAFDQKASGTVWGEGVASLFIKPLSVALRDKDAIYGLVKGIALNNDGASNGITAPSSKSQQNVIKKAWSRAGISAEDISYLESHGTGTRLGDPIEIKGLTSAFNSQTTRKQFCGIGSVKTNIGHTVGVAGLASTIKVLLCMKNDSLPPCINFNEPNDYIEFCSSPVYVNDILQPWESKAPRVAAVSSFGLSGTNCHLVLADAAGTNSEEALDADVSTSCLLTISARNNELLAETISRYRGFLSDERDVRISDMCFTAAVGREHHELRMAIVAQTHEELHERLDAVLRSMVSNGHANIEGVFSTPDVTNVHSRGKARLTRLLDELPNGLRQADDEQLEVIANCYVQGESIPWSFLYENSNATRVHLPAQPFIKQRFWHVNALSIPKSTASSTKKNTSTQAEKTSQQNEYTTAPGTIDIVALFLAAMGSTGRVNGSTESELTTAQKLMSFIVTETLAYKTIKLSDSFYTLGGDSITGATVVHILSHVLGLEVEIAELLGAESLGEFAGCIEKKTGFAASISALSVGEHAPSNEDELPISPIENSHSYVLSRAQYRMYLQAVASVNTTVYNVNTVVELANLPDIDSLNNTMAKVISRHEVLRSIFKVIDGQPCQVVKEDLAFEVQLKTVDCCGSNLENIESIAEQFIQPFELSDGPLLRMMIVNSRDKRAFMIIDMHHIISDGVSMGIIANEIQQIESGIELDAPLIQYRDFAQWDQKQTETDDYRKHADYWLRKFDGDTPETSLDCDYQRPVTREYHGKTIQTRLSAQNTTALSSLAAENNSSLFFVLNAIFRILMRHYQAGDDLCLGTAVTGRNKQQVSGLVGMFVNTLVLRESVNGEEDFLTLLNRVKQNTLDDFSHMEFAYDDLVKELSIPHNSARNPLFDVYFVLQNQDMGLEGESTLVTFTPESGIAKFDLAVICRQSDGELLIDWEYATSLFKSERIAQMTGHFNRLVSLVIENPRSVINDFELVSNEERDFNLLNTFEPPAPCPERSVVNIFTEQVLIQPSAIALIHNGDTVTYHELDEQSNCLANELISRGLKKGEIVAIWCDHTVNMVLAILGVLKSGAAYVPLDTNNPPDRISMIVEDCAAALLITEASANPPSQLVLPVLHLDLIDLSNSSRKAPDVVIESEDLIYVMYTSGSTGKPKGTLIRHKSVVRAVCNSTLITVDNKTTCMLMSTYAFDGCVFDLYGALLNGGRLLLIDKKEMQNTASIARFIDQYKVNSTFLTTALFNAFVDSPENCLKGLNQIFIGGEAASIKHAKKAVELLGENVVQNIYGPTETTVAVTRFSISKADSLTSSVPIGKACSNNNLYILDKRMKPVPVGCKGELYIGGSGVSTGYLNRDELTHQKFIKSPFIEGDILYRTGDLVRTRFDGNILFLGRIDNQVKISGFRIELDEIRRVSFRYEKIIDCVIQAEPNEHGKRTLCAWVVVADVEAFDRAAFRCFLSSELPHYMVPTVIMVMARFQLNNNGKVDLIKLPAPDYSLEAEAFVSPQSETEIVLCAMWGQILGVEVIGVETNFFNLGGNSIAMVSLINAMRSEFGITVDIGDLYKNLNIRAQAVLVEKSVQSLTYELVDEF